MLNFRELDVLPKVTQRPWQVVLLAYIHLKNHSKKKKKKKKDYSEYASNFT